MTELDVYARYPVEIVSGSGCELITADGRTLIDFYGGHATATLGYDHPALVETLARQARTLFFQTNAVELGVRQRAAEKLAAFAPGGLSRVFFVNSGAEANENALRVACLRTGRREVIALTGGFHGRTAAAAACTDGSEAWYGFPETPVSVRRVEPGDAQGLSEAISGDTAAMIFEPVQGMAGAVPIDPGFLRAARALTRDVGALLIADEVQCGMGRTGRPFGVEISGVDVDLLTTAKGIAGGFPAAALLCTEEIASGIGRGQLGTTFGGGPLACALIEQVVDTLSGRGFLETVRERENRIRERCRIGPVVDVQGAGLLLGLRTSCPAKRVLERLLDDGILAGGAKDPNVVRLLPPLVIEDRHIDALALSLERVASEEAPLERTST